MNTQEKKLPQQTVQALYDFKRENYFEADSKTDPTTTCTTILTTTHHVQQGR